MAFRRLPEDVSNTRNLDPAGEVIASDYIEHFPYSPRMPSGLAGTRDDGSIVKELVSVVRMASRHPRYGKYIGRDCMGVQIRSDTPSMVTDTYKENSIEHNILWIVSRDMVATATWSMTFEDGSDATSARH